LLDANKVIDELSVLARDLPDGASGVLNRAIEVIEHLLENQAGAPPEDVHLKMYLSQLINILGHVSMNLSKGPFTTVLTPEQAERRSKPRGPAGCDFTPPPWFHFTPTTPSEPPH